MSWRELMAEMLGDVTQDIIENVGQEFVNAVRVMRRDFDRAMSRVSEEVRNAQSPTMQAVGSCTSTFLQELDRVNRDQVLHMDSALGEISDALRVNRQELKQVWDTMQKSPSGEFVSNAELNLEPVLQAIRKNKATVDLSPVLRAVQERCTKADLDDFAKTLALKRLEVDMQPVLTAIKEMDLSPAVQSALKEKRPEADLSELVEAIREVAAGVHTMRETRCRKDGPGEAKAIAGQDTDLAAVVQTIHEASKGIHDAVQESRSEVLAALNHRPPSRLNKTPNTLK